MAIRITPSPLEGVVSAGPAVHVERELRFRLHAATVRVGIFEGEVTLPTPFHSLLPDWFDDPCWIGGGAYRGNRPFRRF